MQDILKIQIFGKEIQAQQLITGGFPINYFEKVKDLKTGDEIIYITPGGIKTYQVELSIVIEDTDWSYLQETEDNRITLITCVRNQPSKRLCVQAVEKILNKERGI